MLSDNDSENVGGSESVGSGGSIAPVGNVSGVEQVEAVQGDTSQKEFSQGGDDTTMRTHNYTSF